MLIKFTADRQAICTIICKAVNASKPVGMGFLHYEDREYTVEDIAEYLERTNIDIFNTVNIDYFYGRMVKLYIKTKDGMCQVQNDINPEFQSFALTYTDMRDLLKDIDGVIVENGDDDAQTQ